MTVWIGVEMIAILGLAATILIQKVYGNNQDPGPTYIVPTTETVNVSVEDIELPTDLTADEFSDEEEAVVIGDLYETDYSDSVMETLASMSTDQKINLLLLTTPEAICEKDKVTIAGDIFKEALVNNPVSGLFFMDDNFKSQATGMTMLKTVRGWSREQTGMNILLGYRGDMTDATTLSDKGFNLYCFSPDAENATELSGNANDNHMVPAYLAPLSALLTDDERSGFYIGQTDSAEEILEAIDAGDTYLYLVDDYKTVHDTLKASADSGEILTEALDKAAGYALTVRQTLTEMRPEEIEKNPPAEKKTQKKLTPEQQAAENAKALQKQAEQAAKAAQKQAEQAAKAAQKQAEQAAAAAAAAAQTPPAQ